MKLDLNGTALQCIDENNECIFEMPFDSEVVIEDPRAHQHDDIFEEKRDGTDGPDGDKNRKLKPFRRAPASMHCFSIIRHEQRLDIVEFPHCICYDSYSLFIFCVDSLSDFK